MNIPVYVVSLHRSATRPEKWHPLRTLILVAMLLVVVPLGGVLNAAMHREPPLFG